MVFVPSTRHFPTAPPAASRLKAPLLGFRAPTALTVERVHAPIDLRRPGSPVPRDSPTGPTPPTTVPLAGFLNLSAAFFLSLPSCHFQAGRAHGVSPFRGLFLSHSLGDSSPPTCPRDVPPAGCATPVLGGGFRGRIDRYPGCLGRMPLIVFRAFVRVRISLRYRFWLKFRQPTYPSWASTSSWFCSRAGENGFRRATVTLHQQEVRRQTTHQLRSTACHPRGPTLSRESAVPSRSSSPSFDSPVRNPARCWLTRLAPLDLGPPFPSRGL